MGRIFLFVAFGCLFFFSSCKKTETAAYIPVNDYYPLQAGSSFIYRLDSTIDAPFGTALVVHSYLLKDSIESTFNDNLGRLSYRVYRYITDTLQLEGWQYLSTYYITPTTTTVEVMDDNNYRFIKLTAPVVNGGSWMGNSFIDTQSGSSTVQYLDGWNYTYQNTNLPYTVVKGEIDSTVTVVQDDETIPDQPFDPNYYQQRNYSVEVYAKGIGLIYKNFLHWTWQTTPAPASFDDDSYGIALSLISYQ